MKRYQVEESQDKEDLLSEIRDILQEIQPHKIILFGSYSKGTIYSDSDIDLVVVLNKSGLSSSYRELLRNRIEINRLLRKIRAKVPIDLLVYTRDEWDILLNSGSTFFKQIEEDGLRIL